jgi:hypothetical protein
MFLRWKRRARVTIKPAKRSWIIHLRGKLRPTGRFLLTAQLVRSERISGKPRQKVVAYLGAISEEQLGEIGARVGFWRGAMAKLDGLSLDAATRGEIEAELHSRVRRPTPEEVAEADRQLAALADALRS